MMKRDYSWLIELYGDRCISDKEDSECYRKPCACLLCGGYSDNACFDHDQDPCTECNGEDIDRVPYFCVRDEDE